MTKESRPFSSIVALPNTIPGCEFGGGMLPAGTPPQPALRSESGEATNPTGGTAVRLTGVAHDLFGGVEGGEEIFQIAGRLAKFSSARRK